MKQKTHSGLKKRAKVKKGGTVMVQKSCKNHLLSNKSKRQKGAHRGGMPVDSSRRQALRRMLPGAVRVKKIESKSKVAAELKPAATAK